MMKNFIITFSLFAIALPALASAQAQKNGDFPEVRATVNPAKATVGVPLEYRVVVVGKSLSGITFRMPDARVIFPEPATADTKATGKVKDAKDDPSLKVPLCVIHNARKDEKTEAGIAHLTVTVSLSYFRPGKHRLPEIELFDATNTRIGYRVPDVEIESVNQQGEYREIEPPLELGGNYWRVLWIVLALAVAAAGGFFFARWWNARKLAVPPPPEINPLEEFMSGVGALSRKRLIETGQVREYVFEMSALFRAYLTRLLGIDAMDMTVTEIHRAMETHLPRVMYAKNEDDIRAILDLWDLAKFAEFAPSEESLRLNMETCVRLAKNISGARGDVLA
ncbi:MAG: hypothetical protein KBA61_10315 [Spirochaetes bacterium]|nr:hypothetical protein [Spirochaetota bacterium]